MTMSLPRKEDISEAAKKLKITDGNGEFLLVYWADNTFGVVSRSDVINVAASQLQDDSDVYGVECEALYGRKKFRLTILFRGADEEALFRLADRLDAIRRKEEKNKVQTKKRITKKRSLPDFEMDDEVTDPEHNINGKGSKHKEDDSATPNSAKKMSKQDLQKEKKDREKGRAETITNAEAFILKHVHEVLDVPVSNKATNQSANTITPINSPLNTTAFNQPIPPVNSQPSLTASQQLIPPVNSQPSTTASPQPIPPVNSQPSTTASQQLIPPVNSQPSTTASPQPIPPVNSQPSTTASQQPIPLVNSQPSTTAYEQLIPPVNSQPSTTASPQPIPPVNSQPSTTASQQSIPPVNSQPSTLASTYQPILPVFSYPSTNASSHPILSAFSHPSTSMSQSYPEFQPPIYPSHSNTHPSMLNPTLWQQPADYNLMPAVVSQPQYMHETIFRPFTDACSRHINPYPQRMPLRPSTSDCVNEELTLTDMDNPPHSPLNSPQKQCVNCENKQVQIESMSIALDNAAMDIKSLQKRIKELENGRLLATTISNEAQNDEVIDHYMPSRGLQIEHSNYQEVPEEQPVPENFQRLVQGSKIVVPRRWLISFLAKCKGKGPSFMIKKFIDGFFEPEDLANAKASSLYNNLVIQAIRMYAIEKFQIKDSFFNQAVNSKIHTFKRAVENRKTKDDKENKGR